MSDWRVRAYLHTCVHPERLSVRVSVSPVVSARAHDAFGNIVGKVVVKVAGNGVAIVGVPPARIRRVREAHDDDDDPGRGVDHPGVRSVDRQPLVLRKLHPVFFQAVQLLATTDGTRGRTPWPHPARQA